MVGGHGLGLCVSRVCVLCPMSVCPVSFMVCVLYLAEIQGNPGSGEDGGGGWRRAGGKHSR